MTLSVCVWPWRKLTLDVHRQALQVLEFILKRGGEEGVRQAKEEFPDLLKELEAFSYIGPDGRDYGINVRVRQAHVQWMFSFYV